MSDYSSGPGWWQASDGKFYPPESHPTFRLPPPPPPPPPPPARPAERVDALAEALEPYEGVDPRVLDIALRHVERSVRRADQAGYALNEGGRKVLMVSIAFGVLAAVTGATWIWFVAAFFAVTALFCFAGAAAEKRQAR